MDAPEALRSALWKQRRFLILMSLGVIAMYALEVTLKPDAEYNGIAIQLGKPSRIVTGVWIIWAWALWRYLQRAYELLSAIWKDIAEDVYAEDRRIALKTAKREAQRQMDAGQLGESRPNKRVQLVQIERSMKAMLDRGLPADAPDPEPDFVTVDGGRVYERLGGAYTWHDDSGNSGASTFNFTMRWSRWQMYLHVAYSTTQAALRLPAITDHAAPVVIAAIAILAPWLF